MPKEKKARKKRQADHQSDRLYSSAVRNVALWRIVFFLLMTVYEYGNTSVLIPFRQELQIAASRSSPGKDAWFAYAQFRWLQDLHQWLGQNAAWLDEAGRGCGFLAAAGPEFLGTWAWSGATTLFTTIYAIQFWAKATTFTNHHYLFPLLMVLTLLSGGGHYKGIHTSSTKTACESTLVALRAQFAVIYGFASLWKLHADWFNGAICRRIFLSFEEQGRSRGIPWSSLDEHYGIFPLVAISGFMLDFGMFLTLTLAKPAPTTRDIFLGFSLLFHVFTTIAMGQMIGYSFPAVCIAGLLAFLPMGRRKLINGDEREECYDRTLTDWIRTYWKCGFSARSDSTANSEKTSSDVAAKKKDDDYEFEAALIPHGELPPKWRQKFVCVWLAWQVLFPLRMIFVSGGEFPMNRLGYRYSWTMMLHSLHCYIHRQHRSDSPTVLQLSYLTPVCFTPAPELHSDQFMPREFYMGAASTHPMQDSRTVPLHQMLDARESAMLDVFPMHLLSGVAGGVGALIDATAGPWVCRKRFPLTQQEQVGMRWTYFAQLNSRGPFTRLVDPTVDMAAAHREGLRLPYVKVVFNSLFDRRETEFVLSGVGSFWKIAHNAEERLKENFPGAKISLIADRAACLQQQPLWLRPMRQPYFILAVQMPHGYELSIRVEDPPSQDQADSSVPHFEEHRTAVGGDPVRLRTMAAEISVSGPFSSQKCGETSADDILYAIIAP